MTRPSTPFLRQCWYVFGLTEELEPKGWISRRIIGEPLLLLRGDDGELRAVADRCPHRFVPLSMGTICNGTVRCRYHGLAFDSTGRCVDNPHGPVTHALHLRSFPVRQVGPLIWVWMGDAARAAQVPAPSYTCTVSSDYMTRSGYIHSAANYQLMSDNILDLSHVEYLHPALGTEAVGRARVNVESHGDVVVTTRLMTDELLPAGLASVYQTGGARVNREFRVEWRAPSLMELRVTVQPLEGPGDEPRGSYTLHLFTPETEKSTHYFYVAGMDRNHHSPETIDAFRSALDRVFKTEDKPTIDAQQAMIGFDHDIMDLQPVLMGIDKAPVLARRQLNKLINAEHAER